MCFYIDVCYTQPFMVIDRSKDGLHECVFYIDVCYTQPFIVI